MINTMKCIIEPTDQLISGGAAWADHIAVHLFNGNYVRHLKLHLPAPFENGSFLGGYGTSGGAANYYHQKMSKTLGINSLLEIDQALSKHGADYTEQAHAQGYKAMVERNQLVADEAELLIAFTFGEGASPADGGTKITWDMCQGNKVHFSLHNAIYSTGKGGYECSSKGDKRFSAFYAKLKDGRSIEEHYQCDIKGYDIGGRNWRLGKGKPPLDTSKNLFAAYVKLWQEYFDLHPELFKEIAELAKANNYQLNDLFATTPINQANAIAYLLNNSHR